MTAPRRLRPLLRNKFFAGLIILIPIIITAKALWWLFTYVDDLAQPLAVALLGRPNPGVGFLLTLGIVFLTGLLFSSGPLRRLLEGLEEILDFVPVVGAVYGTTKKVLAGFGGEDARQGFQKFVLARLPGRMTPGFLTGSFELEHANGSRERLMTVYVPTNHLYLGDIVVLPPEDVIETQLSMEDGLSLILSAGASIPETLAARK
jgi:uncharacterized membrane protein